MPGILSEIERLKAENETLRKQVEALHLYRTLYRRAVETMRSASYSMTRFQEDAQCLLKPQ